MSLFLQVIDSVFLVAVLGGIGHTLIKVGNMQTKIDTMWEWYKDHVK